MTSSPRLAKNAARALAQESVDVAGSSPERTRTIEAIRTALAARSRRRRAVKWAIPSVAAAAVIVAVVGWRSSESRRTVAATTAGAPAISVEAVRGDVFVERNGARVPLGALRELAFGERIVALQGEATLALVSGTKVDIGQHSSVVLTDEAGLQLVSLAAGVLTAHVAKLGEGRRFVVRSADAEVEVRGTVFRVAREEAACGAVTDVRVVEGRVSVRANGTERVLGAAEEWKASCPAVGAATENPPAPERPLPPSTAPSAAAVPRATISRVTTSPATPPPAAAASQDDLAAQNALFHDAMTAKARGDARAAVSSLEQLLARYPRSPLREAASAQRMKLLAGIDRPRAITAAHEYLGAYPHGFARSDAEAILHDRP